MYKYGNSRVIFIASLLMSCLMPAASVQAQTKTSVTQNLPKTAPSTVTPILSFASPAAGAVSTDGNMTVTLHLDGNADPSTLKVMLNGTDVTSWFSTSSCASAPCNITAQLNSGAGVSAGWDVMMATLKGTTGNAGIAKARFYYGNGVSSSTSATAMARAANVASSSVSVHPADTTLGASTPLTVLPHAVMVSMDPTAGLTIGSTNYPPCSNGTPFNFFRLDRTSLQVLDQECLTAAELPNLIVGLESVVSSNIVFLYSALGTPLGQLNFSSIGGTDFTKSSAPAVSSYQIVGYGQASPGEAYESYVNQSLPQYGKNDISGSLLDAGSSTPFYGFQPTDAPAFAIQAGGFGVDAVITVGYPKVLPFGNTTPTNFTLPANFSQTQYGPSNTTPSYSGQMGVLRVALQPYTLQPFNSVFFPTGTSYSAITDLTNDLANTTNGGVILLTTTGPYPFNSITPGTPTAALEALCAQFELLGISYHACAQLALGRNGSFLNGSFSLAGVKGTPYTVNKTYSSTYEAQGDTGSLNGMFRRNHQFQFVPYQTASLDTSTLPSNPDADDLLEFALPTQIGSAPVTAWPMTDTAGHQAAYAWLSNVIVGHKLFANGTCTAPPGWCTDVRAWYTGNEVTTFAGLDLSGSAVYQYPGDTVAAANGFTSSDFSDVTNQLQAEFIYLNNVLNYQSWFNQQTNGALINTGTSLSAAANEVDASLVQSYATSSTKPLSLDADYLNFAGSYAGIVSTLFPGGGIVGNILKTAASYINISQAGASTNFTLVNIADLLTSTDNSASVAAANYNLQLQTQLSEYFAGVDSDWFKLQAFGILTSTPSSTGWYVENTGTATASYVAALTTGNARVSFYEQLIPQYFAQAWLYDVPVGALEAPPASLSQAQITTTILGTYLPVNSATLGNYSWDNLISPQNSSCQDYTVLVAKKSINSGVLPFTWTTALGTILMGPPSTSDGLGNLNLSRNTFMDAITGGDFYFNNNFNTYQLSGAPQYFNDTQCSVGTLTLTRQIPTTVTIQASATTVSTDGSVTFTVTVQPSTAGSPSPSGIIVVSTGGTAVGKIGLQSGTSTAATGSVIIQGSALPPGTYTLTVDYSGDSGYLSSTGTTPLQVYAPANTTTTTLNVPAAANEGQNVTLQATVAANGSIPAGTVNFQDRSGALGSAALDANGSASITVNTLGVGSHEITAVFTPANTFLYAGSQSAASPLIINPVTPDMLLALSAQSVTVPNGSVSTAVSLTVTSLSSFSGQVSFVCVGLPLGMTCSFNPAQASLPASGTATTSFTISQTPTSSSGIGYVRGPAGIVLFALLMLLALQVSRGRRTVAGVVWMLAVFALTATMLSGCGGNGGSGPTTPQTGTTNILVTATSGTVTKSIPLTVNVE
jgi:hypothetical protein